MRPLEPGNERRGNIKRSVCGAPEVLVAIKRALKTLRRLSRKFLDDTSRK